MYSEVEATVTLASLSSGGARKAIINGNAVAPGKYICQMVAYNTVSSTQRMYQQVEISVTS